MDINIKSLKFDADQKLIAFVEKKVSKLERFYEGLNEVNVTLTLLHEPDKRNAKTFEDAVTECSDAMKEKLTRAREKRIEA